MIRVMESNMKNSIFIVLMLTSMLLFGPVPQTAALAPYDTPGCQTINDSVTFVVAYILCWDLSTITITEATYKMIIDKAGFRYRFEKLDGTKIADKHSTSGVLFTAPNNVTVYNASSTTLPSILSATQNRVQILVTNTNGNQADLYIYPRDTYTKLYLTPRVTGSYTIDFRTALPVLPGGNPSPFYGLGDHGGEGTSTNLIDAGLITNPSPGEIGFKDLDFHLNPSYRRFISNFTVFPANGFAQVLFENGQKRVVIRKNPSAADNPSENRLGAKGVAEVSRMYYYFGTMQEIYKQYKASRDLNLYRSFKPKYDFFELGFESWGALGMNTDQTTVETSIQAYRNSGYRLKWGVIGSGFWPGNRGDPKEGNTSSFGMWSPERYTNPNGLKQTFQVNDMLLCLGTRIDLVAPGTSTYNPSTQGLFADEVLSRGWFLWNVNHLSTFKATWPEGDLLLLDGNKPEAVDWYKNKLNLWYDQPAGSTYTKPKCVKEDTMLNPGSQLYNDAKNQKFNEALMDSGSYVMVRNGAYSVPGELLRINDANFDDPRLLDRTVINALNYAASGAPNVYMDVVGGGTSHITSFLNTPEYGRYIAQNAIMTSFAAGMAMGYNPSGLAPQYKWAVERAALWHTQYAPYIYSAAIDSYETGYPYTMTPLPIAFSQDANTYNLANRTNRLYEWMIGPSMLVAPAYGEDIKFSDIIWRSVYFPAGKWINQYTGAIYTGPKYEWVDMSLSTSYGTPPVFIGGKGVIVYRDLSSEKLYVKIYPIAMGGSQYTFTDPDGLTKSVITNWNTVWTPSQLKVVDQTINTEVSFTTDTQTGALVFPLTKGHNYILQNR